MNQELAVMTPVYYDSGWLVARRGTATTAATAATRALPPTPPTEARRLGRDLGAWGAAVVRTVTAFAPCYQAARIHSPAAPGCFAAALTPLPVRARALTRTLTAALPTLTGGCARLGLAARSASRAVTRDVIRIATSTKPGSRSTPVKAFETLLAAEAAQDRIGLVTRFSILCARQ